MSLTPEEIIGYIQKNEDENWLVECVYLRAVQGFSDPRNDLSKLDNTVHIERILKPFLIQWGMMAQPLTRKGMRWAQLGNKLRKMEPQFRAFGKESLLHIRFDDNTTSTQIKEMYEEIDAVKYVGATGVSKILHIMNPEIFVMWDKNIREKMYDVEDSASGYLKFLGKNKKLLENVFNDKERSDLKSKFPNKTLAKLMDEFNWYIANESSQEILEVRRKVKRIYDC